MEPAKFHRLRIKEANGGHVYWSIQAFLCIAISGWAAKYPDWVFAFASVPFMLVVWVTWVSLSYAFKRWFIDREIRELDSHSNFNSAKGAFGE